MNTFTNILKNDNYRRLFFASFTSQFGTVISTTSFTFYVLDQYGNKPYYATIVQMMYTLPSLFVFFFVGVLADNINRKKIAMYADTINACLCILLMISVFSTSIFVVFPLLFMITAVSKFFVPAQIGLIQGILSNEEYAVAGGLNQMLTSIFLLFGTAFGAFFYLKFGLPVAILLNCSSFLISCFLTFRCHFRKEVVLPKGNFNEFNLDFTLIFSEFKKGMLYIIKHDLLRYLMLGTFILGFVNGGLSIMPVYLLKYKLAAGHYQQAVALSGIFFGTGILTGSFIVSLFVNKIKLYKLMISGFLMASVFIASEFFVTNMLYFFIFYFLTAFFIPVVNVPLYGWLPQVVDSRFMGRVQAWFDPLGNLSQSLFFFIIALTFPKHVSVGTPFLWFGACLLIVAILYMIFLPRAQALSHKHGYEKSE